MSWRNEARSALRGTFDEVDAATLPGRPTWAEMRLDHLTRNFHAIRKHIGPETKILAAVKADAYGHDAAITARHLERLGCEWFGVALPEEGVALRRAGIRQPILCLGGFWKDQASLLLDYGLTAAIHCEWMLDQLNAAARAGETIAPYHLKVDTGMGRLGVPCQELPSFLQHVAHLEHVRLDGLMTHLATANEPAKDDFTLLQIDRFDQASELVRAAGYRPTFIHMANSAAISRHARARGNMVRPGGALYGLFSLIPELRPVMSLHTRIILLKSVSAGSPLGYGGTFVTRRRSRIATLPIGYQDGYCRAFSNTAQVILRGRFAPVVGRVSMDLTLIDVTDIPEAAVGDEVVLLGEKDGLRITAEELARKAHTIPYEITCGISRRVPRVIMKEQD